MKEADDPWWWLQYHGDFSDHVTGIVVCQFGLRVFLREFAFLNLMTCIMIVLWLSWLICLFACFKNCIKCYFSCKYNEYSCGFLLENFFFWVAHMSGTQASYTAKCLDIHWFHVTKQNKYYILLDAGQQWKIG